MKQRSTIFTGATAACTAMIAHAAMAGGHTWRVNEVFSTPDGSIQFIELRECCGGVGEVNIGGAQVRSLTTGKSFTFPANLTGNTANRHLLLATQSFANLPGAPAPDYIFTAAQALNGFFSPNGDTVSYSVYDSLTFTGAELPDDCINSLHDGNIVDANSPTNYAGASDSVNACPAPSCPADLDGNDTVGVSDLLALIGNWGPCDKPCPPCLGELTGNCIVNVGDLLALIGEWGPCDP